jgi:ArsR family transcriptional regulator
MGITKTSAYISRHNRLAKVLKALGHPARLAIVEHLLKTDSCICSTLVDILPLSQPTVSRHLRELKDAGIIQGNIEGASLCYCLNPQVISQIAVYLSDMQMKLQSRKPDSYCC